MRIRYFLVVASACLAALTLTVTPAMAEPTTTAAEVLANPADPAGTTSSSARLDSGQAVDSSATAQKVTDYWTTDRMRRAIPVPEHALGSVTKSQAWRATGPRGSTPPAGAIASAANSLADGSPQLAAVITESAVVGKVFFHDPGDGRDYECSASALNSPSKQLVITAGHCVYFDGNWMQNWVFVPRYRNGARPFGTFMAKEFRTFNAWINYSDLSRDVAMVTTWPLNGNKVVNVVGGNGLAWNWGAFVDVTVLAYPSNFDNGQIQHWCQGRTSYGYYGNKIQCNFDVGASGGPWLMNFDNGTGRGNVNGVVSTIRRDGSGWNESPYFDDAVKTMFDEQGSRT